MATLASVLATTSITLNHLRLTGIMALVAGALILFFPKLLNYFVAGYLILTGLVSVFGIHL